LAALSLDDSRGSALAGLDATLAAEARARLAVLAQLSREARRDRVRDLVRSLTSVSELSDLPPRIASLVAADAPSELSRDALGEAPRVRRGFEADKALRWTARRLAAARSPEGRSPEPPVSGAPPAAGRGDGDAPSR
jgi:hypothetical protein